MRSFASVRDYLIAFLVAGCATVTASPVVQAAACLQWDVAGDWNVIQARSIPLVMSVQQSGSALSGVAGFRTADEAEAKTGTIQGNAVGNELVLNVH